MQATTEKLEGSRVRLSVEVGTDDLHKEYDRAIRRVAGQFNIKGFRRGKAPRRIVENYVSTEYVLRDLMEHLVPRAYSEAVTETGVEPIDEPKLDLPDTPSLDEPLIFSIEVVVAPTVELGELADLKLEVEIPELDEAEVDERMEELRKMRSTWDPVEREAKSGDLVQARVGISGEGIADSEPTEYRIVLGDNGFPTGFDSAVETLKAGETAEFHAVIPADDPNEHLRDKQVLFDIALEGVEERQLPELDDAFAQSVGEYETLEALRNEARERLRDAKRHEAQHRLEDEALDELVARGSFEIAELVFEREQQALIDSQTRSLVDRGIAVDTYLGMTNQTREEWEAEARVGAERRVRRALVLEAYGEEQKISVADDEIEADAERLAGAYPEQRRGEVQERFLRGDARRNLASSIRNRKALAKLVEDLTSGAAPLHDHSGEHGTPAEVEEALDRDAAGDAPDESDAAPAGQAGGDV